MTPKTIIPILFIFLAKLGFSQTKVFTKTITETSYGDIIIDKTLIQNIIKTTNSKLTIDTITYVWGLANIGGGCLRIERTKKFYRYKNLGITYIVSSGDTISGIIFYPPFTGQTYKGVSIGQTKISSLNVPKKGNKIKYFHPEVLGLYRNKKFTENAKHYTLVEEIFYGFKNSRKAVTEIRVGQ